MEQKYPIAASPIQIGPMTLKNRIVVLPMMSALPTPEGRVTDEFVNFCGRQARTGAGLVILGDSSVDRLVGMDHETALDLSTDLAIPGLYAVAEEIHRYGAKASIEISHGGVHAFEVLLENRNPVGPSSWPEGVHPMGPVTPNVTVASGEDLKRIKQQYLSAVGRCVMAGFDCVTIHLGHGWLMSQFLSPVFNRRNDEYGGTFENRLRFPMEVLASIREAFGEKIAIDARISGATRCDPARGELTDEELIRVAQAASQYTDMLNVSVSWAPYQEGSEYMCMSYYLPHMDNAVYAERVKAAVDIPVTATGSITTLAEAESLLADGKCDLVGIGRANMADDGLVWKSLRGLEEQVRPCLRCAWCTGRLQPPYFRKIRCSVNPMLGRELEYRFLPTRSTGPLRVMIVGGGVAGMQAAQTAVMRGHTVSLYEKSEQLGGMVRTTAALPFKADFRRYLDWMIRTTEQCGARVFLNTEVTRELIEREAPDALLLAVGAVPVRPPISGFDQSHVIWVGDADLGLVETGQNVVIAGAGLSGAECAIALAQQGKKVTLIDMMPEERFLSDASGQVMLSIKRLHSELGIHKIFSATVKEITDELVIYEAHDGLRSTPADTVIHALGMKPNRAVLDQLENLVPVTWCIGDCSGRIMNIMNATDSGFTYAMEL